MKKHFCYEIENIAESNLFEMQVLFFSKSAKLQDVSGSRKGFFKIFYNWVMSG